MSKSSDPKYGSVGAEMVRHMIAEVESAEKEQTPSIPEQRTMLCSASSYWDEEEGVWIVTVTSDITDNPYRRYKVYACDEFVPILALLDMHGFNALACLDPTGGFGWRIEDIT